MIIKHLKYFMVYLLVGLLASCSYNDLTDLWPSGNDVEEEIVIREIPEESFDPEDTEEITITEIEESDQVTKNGRRVLIGWTGPAPMQIFNNT